MIMAAVLSFLMTGWVTWLALGLTADFLTRWMIAFRTAWPAAAVISFVTAPAILRLSIRLSDALTRQSA